MKPWLLFLSMSAAMATTQAAPARKVARPQWEYAVLDISVGYRNREGTLPTYRYGSELHLPDGRVIKLSATDTNSTKYKAYLLNRMGVQGWELVTGAGTNGGEARYIFKRLKR